LVAQGAVQVRSNGVALGVELVTRGAVLREEDLTAGGVRRQRQGRLVFLDDLAARRRRLSCEQALRSLAEFGIGELEQLVAPGRVELAEREHTLLGGVQQLLQIYRPAE